MVRHAAANNLALPEVLMSATSGPDTARSASATERIKAFITAVRKSGSSGFGEQGALWFAQLSRHQRRQQIDRVGKADDRNVRDVGVTAMLDQAMLGEHEIRLARRAEIRSAVADQQHAAMLVVRPHGADALAITARDPAMRIRERRLQLPRTLAGLHQMIGLHRQPVQPVAAQDGFDRVIQTVADHRQGHAGGDRGRDESGKGGIDPQTLEVFVDLLARSIQQRDLAGHARRRTDLAFAPFAFQLQPVRMREALQQRVGGVLDGDGAVEVAEDVPLAHCGFRLDSVCSVGRKGFRDAYGEPARLADALNGIGCAGERTRQDAEGGLLGERWTRKPSNRVNFLKKAINHYRIAGTSPAPFARSAAAARSRVQAPARIPPRVKSRAPAGPRSAWTHRSPRQPAVPSPGTPGPRRYRARPAPSSRP